MVPRLWSAWLVCWLVAGVSAGAMAGEAPRPAGPDNVLARLKVDDPRGGILVPVELKGRTYCFLLDTGAGATVYDTSLRPLLGEAKGTEEAEATSGSVTVEAFDPPPARLGGLRLPTDKPVFAVDLGRLRQAMGREVYGILGMDFLARHVVRIDFDGREVCFLRSPGEAPGRRVGLDLDTGVPYLEAALPGGRRQNFLLDTGRCGFKSGSLSKDAFSALAESGGVSGVGRCRFADLSRTESAREGRVNQFAAGDFRHDNLVFDEARTNALSLTYLSRYTATFDFPHGALYLREGKRYAAPDLRDLSGLHLLRAGGRTVVESVDAGSPAAAAGVGPGDVLTRVGDAAAADLSLRAAREAFCAQGKVVPLTVARRGRTLTLTLRLEEWRTSAGEKEGKPVPAP